MELSKSRPSSIDGQPTSLGEDVQRRSVVVVALDATKDLRLPALQYALNNVVRPKDTLYLLGILHPVSDKVSTMKFNTINTEMSRRKLEFHRGIADNHEIQKLFASKKIIHTVNIVVGPDRKAETAKHAVELRARWVILDKHMKEDKGYLMEHLNCNIVLMGKNEAKFIKIELSGAENPNVLEWKARWKTALGITQGLLYLHEKCRVRCTVHRDTRPQNVFPKDGNYLAPEYEESGSTTEKADVYSLGIILLELITGLEANEITRRSPEKSLMEWARPLIEAGKTLEIVDPQLLDFCDKDQVNKMAHAARCCVNKDPTYRPAMSEVLDILKGKGRSMGLKSRDSSASDISTIARNLSMKQSLVHPIARQGSVLSHGDGFASSSKSSDDGFPSFSSTTSSSSYHRGYIRVPVRKPPPPKARLCYDEMVVQM